MTKLIFYTLLFTVITANAQTTIKNKTIDYPILFNNEIVYSYFKKFEHRMKRKDAYIKPERLNLYAIFVEEGILKKPTALNKKHKGILYKSESGNKIILLPDSTRKSKRRLFKLLKSFYIK